MKAKYERKGEINFVLIGAKSTGKTVYLYNLNDRTEVTTSDSSTIDYLDSLKSTDDKNETINATSASYTELYFNYKVKKYNIDFQIDDYDGNFVETWHSDENSDYKDKLTAYIKEAEGIFVFLPFEENDTDSRFESMKKETDTFIEKIREEYGEEHSNLPIPVVITVTKWDDSPYFLAENENEEAKRYIEENPVLKDIKDKLSNYFKTVDIIPLSSEKNHNVILPIQIALDYTFSSWEERIQVLLEKENKNDLIIFLYPLLYDLKFYKDGLYKKFYEETESKIAKPILEEINNITLLKEFKNYYNSYENILEVLTDEHQDIIQNKKNSLIRKSNLKLVGLVLLGVTILSLTALFYNKYTVKEAENLLYKNIKTEYTLNNYSDVLGDIQQYYLSHKDVDKKHYDEIKLLEETTKDKYRKEIDKKIMKLQSTVSLKKKFKILNDITAQVKKYDVSSVKLEMINKKFIIIKKDKITFDYALNLISKISLETINKDDIDIILTSINQLSEYDEAVLLKQRLQDKLNLAINASSESDSEDIIETMINLGSTTSITQEQLEKLNKRLKELRIKSKIIFFIDELKAQDELKEAINYIAINWQDIYGESTRMVIQKILSLKFSSFIDNTFGSTSSSINTIDDYNKLFAMYNNYTKLMKSLESLPIKITINLSDDENILYSTRVKLLTEYYNVLNKDGVYTSTFTFFAKKNNSLGFSKSDDEISIWINDYLLYKPKDSSGSYESDMGYLMKFSAHIRYKASSYNIKVVEHNTLYDDSVLTGSFTISKNDIIKLYNEGSIHVQIAHTDYILVLNK